jgi:hypothetical protein
MFRIQEEDEYYLYVIKRDGQIEGTQKTILSGLYKVSPRYSEVNITSDGMFKIRAKLLATTSQKYINKESNYIFIMAYYDTIRIFDQINGRPIIEYKDLDNPYLDGRFGFQSFRQGDVSFNDIEVLY